MHGVWRGAVSAGHGGRAHRGEKEVVVGWRDQSVTYEAPGADLAARGEVALIINGVTVCLPGDRGGHMGAAIVGVASLGLCLPDWGALLATGNGDLRRHPRCLFCAPSPVTLFHVELDVDMTKTVVAWELGHTFTLTDSGGD